MKSEKSFVAVDSFTAISMALENSNTDLASRFELSGGEIDNIARKTTMEEVLSGNRPTLEVIKQWCRDENMNDSISRKIGFAS